MREHFTLVFVYLCLKLLEYIGPKIEILARLTGRDKSPRKLVVTPLRIVALDCPLVEI